MPLTFIRTLALGTILSLGAVACSGDSSTETGSDDTDNGIVTLSEESTDSDADSSESTSDETESTDSADAPDDPELAFALYGECMAEFGIDFQFSIAGEGGERLDITEETIELDDPQAGGDFGDFDMSDFDDANRECEKHLANIDSGFDLTPEQQAQMEDAQIEWAACMRELGVDVPDMSGDGSSIIIIEVGGDESDPQSGGEFGGDDFDFEAFEEAANECNSAFGELNEAFEGAEG